MEWVIENRVADPACRGSGRLRGEATWLGFEGRAGFPSPKCGKSIASKRHSKKKGAWCSGKARRPEG